MIPSIDNGGGSCGAPIVANRPRAITATGDLKVSRGQVGSNPPVEPGAVEPPAISGVHKTESEHFFTTHGGYRFVLAEGLKLESVDVYYCQVAIWS